VEAEVAGHLGMEGEAEVGALADRDRATLVGRQHLDGGTAPLDDGGPDEDGAEAAGASAIGSSRSSSKESSWRP
jgi:hypothetical protein